MLRRLIAALLALGGAALAGEGAPAARLADFDLPLTVQESAGVERKGDLCSTGVPIALGAMQEPEGIALFDERGAAVPAQFRVLERWRNFGEDKSVKWLLLTFLADVPKDGKAVYHLKAGKNPAPAKPVSIVERGDAYEMGGQVFRKDFSAPFKLVLTDPDGKELTAADVPVTWSVWENGPVRACLKAESPTVPDKFGFVAWIYAFAGQDGSTPLTAGRWDMTVVLKNTPQKFRGPFYFKDFSVVWEPPELKGAKDFLLGGEAGKAVSGQLDGASAYLYQASDGTDKWEEIKAWGRHHGLNGAKPEFRGYKTFAGQKELGAGNAALGWAALNSGARGALACTRYFRPQFPKVVEVEPGRIVVRLWPQQWKSHGGLFWLDDLSRKAYDLSFRLASRPVTAQEGDDAAKSADSFLVAHAPSSWYRGRSAEPVAGAEREEPDKNAKRREDAGTSDWVNFGWGQTKTFKFHYHGGSLDGYALLSGGDPAAAHGLFAQTRTSAGMIPFWLDDYQYPRDVKALKHTHYCNPLREPYKGYRPGTGNHGWEPWNHSHFFCGEVFDAWRLFGDPLAGEAVKGVGAYCQAYVDFREGPKWKENIPRPLGHNAATWEGGGGLPAGSRADGCPLHNLCQAYSITGDEAMMSSLRRFAAVSWRQVDKERGVYAVGVSPGPDSELGLPKGTTTEDPSMVGQVMDGLMSYYLLSHDETTADQITGMLDWVVAEGTAGKYGHLYHLVLNDAELYAKRRNGYVDGVKARRGGGLYFQIDPYLYLFAYGYTGDKCYRDEWIMLREGRNEFKVGLGGWLCALHYRSATQFDIFDNPRKGQAPEPVKDLAAEALSGGKVKLTWSAPAGGAARYQVKWADKRIVERLNFDREKRTFTFDPKDHANWWAANNVEGEPKPGTAGAKEAMTIEDVSPGKRFFAVRSFDSASNRSAMSNVVDVEVK